jgi:hypothetical protein
VRPLRQDGPREARTEALLVPGVQARVVLLAALSEKALGPGRARGGVRQQRGAAGGGGMYWYRSATGTYSKQATGTVVLQVRRAGSGGDPWVLQYYRVLVL